MEGRLLCALSLRGLYFSYVPPARSRQAHTHTHAHIYVHAHMHGPTPHRSADTTGAEKDGGEAPFVCRIYRGRRARVRNLKKVNIYRRAGTSKRLRFRIFRFSRPRGTRGAPCPQLHPRLLRFVFMARAYAPARSGVKCTSSGSR